MSRAQMLDHLVAQHGCRCQGCDRTFDDPRYLQLDHNTPRADGGITHITNRVLLCGPCNQLKAHIYTLSRAAPGEHEAWLHGGLRLAAGKALRTGEDHRSPGCLPNQRRRFESSSPLVRDQGRAHPKACVNLTASHGWMGNSRPDL